MVKRPAWIECAHHSLGGELGTVGQRNTIHDSVTIEHFGDVGIRFMEMFGAWENDLGYIIHHDFWRQGYAFEAASGAVSWARRAGLADVCANMANDNSGSVAVAEKLGMRREREFVNPRNRNKLTYWYRLNLSR